MFTWWLRLHSVPTWLRQENRVSQTSQRRQVGRMIHSLIGHDFSHFSRFLTHTRTHTFTYTTVFQRLTDLPFDYKSIKFSNRWPVPWLGTKQAKFLANINSLSTFEQTSSCRHACTHPVTLKYHRISILTDDLTHGNQFIFCLFTPSIPFVRQIVTAFKATRSFTLMHSVNLRCLLTVESKPLTLLTGYLEWKCDSTT